MASKFSEQQEIFRKFSGFEAQKLIKELPSQSAMRIDRKYEGKCIAIVRGKIVASGIDIKKVAAESRARYPHDEITLTNVIKGDRVFIF